MRTKACLLCVLVTAGLAVPTAFAADNRYQGTFCQPAFSSEVAKIGYSQYGVHNLSISTAKVACGAAPTVGSDVSKMEVVVYDRNSVSPVCCTLEVQNPNGSFLYSALRCSIGMGAAAQTLSWVPPINAVGTANLECSIPPATINGVSHVTSYRLVSSP